MSRRRNGSRSALFIVTNKSNIHFNVCVMGIRTMLGVADDRLRRANK